MASPKLPVLFIDCEVSRECSGCWCLLVMEGAVKGYEDHYTINVSLPDSHVIVGKIYFTAQTLPDYLKDALSMIKTWRLARGGYIADYRFVSVSVRPELVPDEFKSIGWMRSADCYVVVLTYDQLRDLSSYAPSNMVHSKSYSYRLCEDDLESYPAITGRSRITDAV